MRDALLRPRTLTLGIVVYRNNQYLLNYHTEKEHLPTNPLWPNHEAGWNLSYDVGLKSETFNLTNFHGEW